MDRGACGLSSTVCHKSVGHNLVPEQDKAKTYVPTIDWCFPLGNILLSSLLECSILCLLKILALEGSKRKYDDLLTFID